MITKIAKTLEDKSTQLARIAAHTH